MQLCRRETVPPCQTPSAYLLTGDGKHKLTGEVLDTRGSRRTCTLTVWYCSPGKHSSYHAGHVPDFCTTVDSRNGLFDIHHSWPGMYGPSFLPPHLKYRVLTTDNRTFFGTIPLKPSTAVTHVQIVV